MKSFYFFSIVLLSGLSCCFADESEFAPKQDKLPVAPPEGAVVLFAGNSAEMFTNKFGKEVNWPVRDGEIVSTAKDNRSNHIVSKLHFRDADIHVEFNTADKSQGNSGVYIHGHYEMQILNTSGKNPPNNHDIGALYGIHAPLLHAGRKRGDWQVYDVRYRAPRRDEAGKIVKKGSVTAWLNGRKVLENAEFEEPVSVYHPYRHDSTPYLGRIEKQLLKTGVGPVFLQDHDSPCRFRNVWVKALDSKAFFYDGSNAPPTDERPTDERPTDERPTDERPMDGQPKNQAGEKK